MNLELKLIILYFFIVGGSTEDVSDPKQKKCGYVSECVYTDRAGDITLKYGDPLEITCRICDHCAGDYTNASSMLYFTRHVPTLDPKKKIDDSTHYQPIPIVLTPNDEFDPNDEAAPIIEILNRTSIRLTVKKPNKTEGDYYLCSFNSTQWINVPSTNVVIVGQPPEKVKDFACVSENYEQLKCSWTAPENTIVTQYYLYYNFNQTKGTQYHCPTYPIRDKYGANLNCTWSLNTTPQYRQAKKVYNFTLFINNSLGETYQYFNFDHFSNMRPKPVENLSAVATSKSSIQLTWKYSSRLDGFTRPLEGEILYTCTYCNQSSNQSWIPGGTFNTTKVTTFALKDLEYPHAVYDIRLRIKPLGADAKMWSDYAFTYVLTLSDIPLHPPLVDQGSFQIVNTMNPMERSVYVYFQYLEDREKNGENFTYDIVATPPLKIKEQTKAYVKFEGLSDRDYIIQIWSKNEVGRSRTHSELVVPARTLHEPEKFIKIDLSFNRYELHWEKSKYDELVKNYTLFWCVHERERPHQCTGYLDWIVLPNNTFTYKKTFNDNLNRQFAVSANGDRSSSGMRWAECTVLANKTVGKMRNVWVNNVGSDFIELSWTLECSDILSEVTGYVITYCRTSSSTISKENHCEGEIQNKTINGTLLTASARIDHLIPSTTYLLAVSVKSTSTISQPSDWYRNVTSPAAPSVPLNVTPVNITNSSITITWSPPALLNGPLNAYFIYYNDKHFKVDTSNNRSNFEKNVEILENLESYTKYVIYMQACNGHLCSENSKNETVVTKMGIPAKIDPPYTTGSRDENIVRWNPPHPPRGDINYYQLSITQDGTDMEEGALINVTSANNYTIENCRDAGLHTFFVAVRAVNIIDGEHVRGPWSDFVKIYCYSASWYIYIYVIVGILGMVCIGYGLKKLYMCWNIARHVEIKLPPGLAPAVEHHSEKNSDIIEMNFKHDPDEERLLERMNEKCPIVDSSGCSSGQESISSSVESSTHLSIDSGTDQPRNVSDDNKENSLRLRNVPSKGYVMHDSTPLVNRGTKPPVAPAGSYCLIGVDTTSKPSSDSPYVSVSDTEQPVLSYSANDQLPEGPTQYLVTDIFKTPNPGYIPFPGCIPYEPSNKNTGYVVAGNLTSAPILEPQKELTVADPQMVLKPTIERQEPAVETSLSKQGYVSVGDAPPPIIVREAKGYVPHRHFEKTLKEE